MAHWQGSEPTGTDREDTMVTVPWRDSLGNTLHLAPGIAEFIEAYEAVGPRPSRLEEARLSFDSSSQQAHASLRAHLDISNWYLATPGREIPLRLYRPQGGGPFATLIYFHGGGWVVGSLESHDRIAAEIAHGAGVQVIAVHYRRAPENPFPAAVEDGREVLRWALRDGDLHAIDPTRIGVAGDSAGGHVAVALTQVAKSGLEYAPPLRCQILIYPAIEPDFTTASYCENEAAPILTSADMRRFWDLYMPSGGEDDPVRFPMRARDMRGLPASLIVTAQYDPLRDDGQNYARALKAAGCEVELRNVTGMVHSFLRAIDHSEVARSELAYICARLREHMDIGSPDQSGGTA